MSTFKTIKPSEVTANAFKAIGEDWMLVTAQKSNGTANTMTASWGGFGEMWGKRVVYIVIRPQRYTKEFVDEADTFSLSFLGTAHKGTFGYLGKVSGRDEDKIGKSGLTLVHQNNTPYFSEADMAMICKKMYKQEMMPQCFIDTSQDAKWYPNGDYHTLYIAEVTDVLVKE